MNELINMYQVINANLELVHATHVALKSHIDRVKVIVKEEINHKIVWLTEFKDYLQKTIEGEKRLEEKWLALFLYSPEITLEMQAVISQNKYSAEKSFQTLFDYITDEIKMLKETARDENVKRNENPEKNTSREKSEND